MLTPGEVMRLACENGLADQAEELVAWVRPGWRLLPDGIDGPGASKVGGDPDLADGEAWPVNPRGVPMAFVAQINCTELSPLDPPWKLSTPWRHDGQLIRIFADLLDNPVSPCAAVGLRADPSGPLTRTAAPPIPEPFPSGGEWDGYQPRDYLYRLPETIVRLRPFLTAPEIDEWSPRFEDWGEQRVARYEEWAAAVRVVGANESPFPYGIQHVLGEPISIQDHVRHVGPLVHHADSPWDRSRWVAPDPALTHIDAWEVLLGLHMADQFGLQIHDGGALHVLVPADDLAVGTLDRLICANDSG
jgi:hypothetical protein